MTFYKNYSVPRADTNWHLQASLGCTGTLIRTYIMKRYRVKRK